MHTIRSIPLALAVSALAMIWQPAWAEEFTGHWFGGGGPDDGVMLSGVWSFDQHSEAQADSVEPCAHGSIGVRGDILDWQGWAPSPESNVLPRVEMMDADWIDPAQFPDGIDLGNVGGGVLAFYATVEGEPGFLPLQLSLMESPMVDLAALDIPGDPLEFVFSSACAPDPELGLLEWIVGVRYYDGVAWSPWLDQSAPMTFGANEHGFDLEMIGPWTTVQFRVGVRNPSEIQLLGKKGPAGDKAKAGAKPPSVLDQTWKYVPDITQDTKPTCAGASAADCLAYWAKGGYPEIMPAAADTAKRHGKLRDELIKEIYGADGKVGGTGADADNWGGGISSYLKKKGAYDGTPQPNGRTPLIHERKENPSCDYMRQEFGQCHDVMIFFKWCDDDGKVIKNSDGSVPAHQATLAGLVKTSDGKTTGHAAHGWGKSTDEVTEANRGTAYDQFEIECVDGKIKMKNEELLKKYKGKGATHLCVTEINVVKPKPQGFAAPRLLAALTPSPLDKAGRDLIDYAYSIVNDAGEPMNYFAMILEVPFEDVQTPAGWTWQPLPAPFPNATDCNEWLGRSGILWSTAGDPVPPGGVLGGFGFSTSSAYPPATLGGQWYTQTTLGTGLYGFVEGPALPEGAGVPEPPERTMADGSALRVFPNPAHDGVTVDLALPHAGAYRIEIFDAAGRRIRTYRDVITGGDAFRWTWDGRDSTGRRVPAGAYFCRVGTGGEFVQERLILLR